MKIIYMAHPVSGDVENNLAKARRWYKWISSNYDVIVLANWIVDCEVFDNSTDYDAVLRKDEEIVRRCVDELWLVGGEISPGMKRESVAASVVKDLTHLGAEPPTEKP